MADIIVERLGPRTVARSLLLGRRVFLWCLVNHSLRLCSVCALQSVLVYVLGIPRVE